MPNEPLQSTAQSAGALRRQLSFGVSPKIKRDKMAIRVDEVEVRAVYRTESDQLRLVEKIDSDAEGRLRVYYKAKSARIPGRPFDIAHTLDNPPLASSFAQACSHRLEDEELRQLVIEGVLTREELAG